MFNIKNLRLNYIMLEKISKFLNDNPLLGILIVLLLVVLLWNIFDKKEKYTEHLDVAINKCDVNTDHNFGSSFVSKPNSAQKLVNFRCKIGDKEYYLSSKNISECKNDANVAIGDENKTKPQATDCTYALVLIEKKELEESMHKYNRIANRHSKICDFTKKTHCLYELPDPDNPSKDDKEKCDKRDDACVVNNQYHHDFMVKEVASPNPGDLNKYIIMGAMHDPEKKSPSAITMINQYHHGHDGIKFVCADDFGYKKPGVLDEYAEIMVWEEVNKKSDSGIIGGAGNEHSLKVTLKFNTPINLTPTNPNDPNKYLFTPSVDSSTGKHRTESSYLGICVDDNDKCGNSFRVCLYKDSNDIKVLKFEPVLSPRQL